MNQQTFLDKYSEPMTPIARQSDPTTSHKAAAQTNVARSHELVLDALTRQAFTAEEIEDMIFSTGEKISGSRVRGALSEMCSENPPKVRIVNTFGTSRCGKACAVYARVQ